MPLSGPASSVVTKATLSIGQSGLEMLEPSFMEKIWTSTATILPANDSGDFRTSHRLTVCGVTPLCSFTCWQPQQTGKPIRKNISVDQSLMVCTPHLCSLGPRYHMHHALCFSRDLNKTCPEPTRGTYQFRLLFRVPCPHKTRSDRRDTPCHRTAKRVPHPLLVCGHPVREYLRVPWFLPSLPLTFHRVHRHQT